MMQRRTAGSISTSSRLASRQIGKLVNRAFVVVVIVH